MDVHPSYRWQRDNSLPDVFLGENHFFIDIVLGNNLITALKDEGAANSFITQGLVKACGLYDQMIFDKSGSEGFTNADGGLMEILGVIRNANLQIGDIDYTLKVVYVTPELHHFFILGADVFHEERIYRIGQNDREKVMKFALDRDGKTIVTTVTLRHNPKAEPGTLKNIRNADPSSLQSLPTAPTSSHGRT
jgi:hypothetical protein